MRLLIHKILNLCLYCGINTSAGNGQWPNAPNFCLGPPEISKILALVAQIYSSSKVNCIGFSANRQFGPLKVWSVQLLGHHVNLIKKCEEH